MICTSTVTIRVGQPYWQIHVTVKKFMPAFYKTFGNQSWQGVTWFLHF